MHVHETVQKWTFQVIHNVEHKIVEKSLAVIFFFTLNPKIE